MAERLVAAVRAPVPALYRRRLGEIRLCSAGMGLGLLLYSPAKGAGDITREINITFPSPCPVYLWPRALRTFGTSWPRACAQGHSVPTVLVIFGLL